MCILDNIDYGPLDSSGCWILVTNPLQCYLLTDFNVVSKIKWKLIFPFKVLPLIFQSPVLDFFLFTNVKHFSFCFPCQSYIAIFHFYFYYFILPAEDGALLGKIEKVRVLRNDRREGMDLTLSNGWGVVTKANIFEYNY